VAMFSSSSTSSRVDERPSTCRHCEPTAQPISPPGSENSDSGNRPLNCALAVTDSSLYSATRSPIIQSIRSIGLAYPLGRPAMAPGLNCGLAAPLATLVSQALAKGLNHWQPSAPGAASDCVPTVRL